MPHDPVNHHRHSIRLRDYDYSQAGAYFVTICASNRGLMFGRTVGGALDLNALGEIVQECWGELPYHFVNVELDEFVVMPNHVHGIVVILDSPVGARHASPLLNAQTSRETRGFRAIGSATITNASFAMRKS